MAFRRVLGVGELAVGRVRRVDVDGKRLVIVNYDGEYFALDGVCTHEQCDLGDGVLEGSRLTCACHGGQFDVRDGEAVRLPVVVGLRVYATRVVGGGIEVDWE